MKSEDARMEVDRAKTPAQLRRGDPSEVLELIARYKGGRDRTKRPDRKIGSYFFIMLWKQGSGQSP